MCTGSSHRVFTGARRTRPAPRRDPRPLPGGPPGAGPFRGGSPPARTGRAPPPGREIRVRRPAAGRKDRDRYFSGKNKQNTVKTMALTDGDGRLLFSSPTTPGSCAGIAHARQLGLVKLLADGPAVEILADAGYQGLGARTGGRVVTPPHRKPRKNAPDWYEETHQRQRKAHSSRRIRVRHNIAHLKNWRAPARHIGRREHMNDMVQTVAGLPSHQQTGDLSPQRQR
ncbi:transposase family protein [Streptomyces nitrosporeus]|uniref:transposase family protein n=1 Tax=Streptomyces nitrosporeus TaxID=28894 RepID=UPI00399F7F6A